MNPILSATVNAKRMDVPAAAQEKFARACNAVREKKLSVAEESLNQAVKLYPQFSAAWVLLGQVAADQGHNEKAAQACTTARNEDATYLPGYLCLADIAARQQRWNEVAELTNQVLGMHPIKAPAAFYYNCLAYFYLRQFPAAEKSALNALTNVPKQGEPQVHWLLAKIYEQEGKRELEAEQLREYLKLSPNAVDAPIAKQILKQIKAEPPARNAAAEPR
jgi:Tfp pilus assembly protein PilF